MTNEPEGAQAVSEVVPDEELEGVQRIAEITRVAEHLAGQGNEVVCRVRGRQTWPVTGLSRCCHPVLPVAEVLVWTSVASEHGLGRESAGVIRTELAGARFQHDLSTSEASAGDDPLSWRK